MTDINYEELDPGIRDTVALLRSHGFETTDSGDGVSKFADGAEPMDCAIDIPHVFCVLDDMHAETFFNEADRAQELLGDEWTVEATYAPKDGHSLLMCFRYPAGVELV